MKVIPAAQLSSPKRGEPGAAGILRAVIDDPEEVFLVLRRARPVAVVMSAERFDRLTGILKACQEGE